MTSKLNLEKLSQISGVAETIKEFREEVQDQPDVSTETTNMVKKKVSIKKCVLKVKPDTQGGRGHVIEVIGDCAKELGKIKDNMGPQGWRYFEKRLIHEK